MVDLSSRRRPHGPDCRDGTERVAEAEVRARSRKPVVRHAGAVERDRGGGGDGAAPLERVDERLVGAWRA
jgi:hypothetical protein